MKEIKVKILGDEISTGKHILKCEVVEQPQFMSISDKTYRLVEDEPKQKDISRLYEKTIFLLTHGTSGIRSEGSIPHYKVEEWVKANPNAFKQPTFSAYVGERSCGKTVKQAWFDEFTTYKPKARVMFNGNATILEIGGFKTVVKCDKDDEFNEIIGLGLALSRYYKKQKSTKKEIVLLEKMLSYNMLAEYCFHKYFNHNDKRMDKFVDVCMTQGKWIELD